MPTPLEHQTKALLDMLAPVALEQAMQAVAEKAIELAPSAKGLDGEQALLTFARAILNTNARAWPANDRGSKQ